MSIAESAPTLANRVVKVGSYPELHGSTSGPAYVINLLDGDLLYSTATIFTIGEAETALENVRQLRTPEGAMPTAPDIQAVAVEVRAAARDTLGTERVLIAPNDRGEQAVFVLFSSERTDFDTLAEQAEELYRRVNAIWSPDIKLPPIYVRAG